MTEQEKAIKRLMKMVNDMADSVVIERELVNELRAAHRRGYDTAFDRYAKLMKEVRR